MDVKTGWQPIETAPLDGTALLLHVSGVRSWNRKEGMPDIVVGLYAPLWAKTSWDSGRTWHTGAWYSDLGDVDQGYESTGAYFEHEPLNPTHWMPLPAPPRLQTEDTQV